MHSNCKAVVLMINSCFHCAEENIPVLPKFFPEFFPCGNTVTAPSGCWLWFGSPTTAVVTATGLARAVKILPLSQPLLVTGAGRWRGWGRGNVRLRAPGWGGHVTTMGEGEGGGMLPLWGTGSVGVRAMLFWCSIIIHSGLHSSHTSSHSSWGGRGDKTPAPTAHPRHRGGLFSRVPLTPNGRSSWFSVCFDVSRAWMEGLE